LKDLKDTPTGMFDPESSLEIQYPIHSVNPVKDAVFESEIIYFANTYPLSQELEFRPEVPVIEAIHMRRRLKIGKEVTPIGDLGEYQITIMLENTGTAPLLNINLLDKVPDSFEYGQFSQKPEITDEVGSDTLKWVIKQVEPGEKIEISYEIKGTGDYHASDAQQGY